MKLKIVSERQFKDRRPGEIWLIDGIEYLSVNVGNRKPAMISMNSDFNRWSDDVYMEPENAVFVGRVTRMTATVERTI